jgi:Tol biopolymer transport system component
VATKKSSLLAVIAVVAVLLVPSGAQGVPGPDGRIAFSRQDPWSDDYDIWLVNPDGTDEVNITNTPNVSEHDPNWSPDGTKIAFSASVEDPEEPGSFFSDIFIIDADGGNRTNVTATPDQSDYMPSWSPTGEEIVFAAEVPGKVITIQTDIFTISSTEARRPG